MSLKSFTPFAVQIEASGCSLIHFSIKSKLSCYHHHIYMKNTSTPWPCFFWTQTHRERSERYTYLILGETHLNNTMRVVLGMKRVSVVGFPAIKIRRVLAMAVAGGDLGQKLITLLASQTRHILLLDLENLITRTKDLIFQWIVYKYLTMYISEMTWGIYSLL